MGSRCVGMVCGRAHRHPAQVGAKSPGTQANHEFGIEQVARHAGDLLARVLTRAKVEVAVGPASTIVQRPHAHALAAREAQLHALVQRSSPVVVGAHLDAIGVGGGDEFVGHHAAVHRRVPLQGLRALAQAALAAQFERGGTLRFQAHQLGAGSSRVIGRDGGAKDFPVGGRLVAAAEVGPQARGRRKLPVHADLGCGEVPVLVELGRAGAAGGIAGDLAPLQAAQHRPARGYAPVGRSQSLQVAGVQVVGAKALHLLAVGRVGGVQVALHLALRPRQRGAPAHGASSAVGPAAGLPLRAGGAAVRHGVVGLVVEQIVGVLPIHTHFMAQRLAAPGGAVGQTQLRGSAARVALVNVEQLVLRRFAVAQDAARVGADAVFGHHAGDLESQVGPVQVGAVFKSAIALETHIGL